MREAWQIKLLSCRHKESHGNVVQHHCFGSKWDRIGYRKAVRKPDQPKEIHYCLKKYFLWKLSVQPWNNMGGEKGFSALPTNKWLLKVCNFKKSYRLCYSRLCFKKPIPYCGIIGCVTNIGRWWISEIYPRLVSPWIASLCSFALPGFCLNWIYVLKTVIFLLTVHGEQKVLFFILKSNTKSGMEDLSDKDRLKMEIEQLKKELPLQRMLVRTTV